MATKLPQDVFIQTFEHVPRIALNLLITNKNNQVLLTKRAKPPLEHMWHIPGSFLLKGETLQQCLHRVALDELGIILETQPKLLGVFEDIDKDPRGHIIDVVYGTTIDEHHFKPHNDSEAIQFFEKLPQDIGFNHQETLENLGFR